MTEATAAVEDSGAPAILDTKDVVDMFKQCNLAVYAEARREFYREVSLNPFKPYPEGLLRMIEWQFWDWFSFDCSISDIGLTGDESSDMRVELVHNKDNGISPFRAMAEYVYAVDPQVGERKLQDFRDIDDTNFASMFWIKDANAVKGIMTVEDLINGGIYDVASPQAAEYDGTRGGLIVNRIARVRGRWQGCAIPIYEAHRPDDPKTGEAIARSFRHSGYRPDFPGLVRFFYGRAKDTGLDWEEAVAAKKTGMLNQLIEQARD